MRFRMKQGWRIILISCYIVPLLFTTALATVEWELQETISMDTTPLDIAISLDNKRIFILNNQGEILVYSKDGRLTETLNVGKHINQIKVGPRDNVLFLTSRKKKTVEVVELDFIQDINTAGSPFKGPPDAPVAVIVFSDFQ